MKRATTERRNLEIKNEYNRLKKQGFTENKIEAELGERYYLSSNSIRRIYYNIYNSVKTLDEVLGDEEDTNDRRITLEIVLK